jgi:hypothetical protein
MLSPQSLKIQSYLFSNKTAQGARASLPEQRAWFDTMIEKYADIQSHYQKEHASSR